MCMKFRDCASKSEVSIPKGWIREREGSVVSSQPAIHIKISVARPSVALWVALALLEAETRHSFIRSLTCSLLLCFARIACSSCSITVAASSSSAPHRHSTLPPSSASSCVMNNSLPSNPEEVQATMKKNQDALLDIEHMITSVRYDLFIFIASMFFKQSDP